MVKETTQTINIVTKYFTVGQRRAQKVVQQTQLLSDTTKKLTTRTKVLNDGVYAKTTRVVKTMTGNFRRFKMELLSVMFGAQMVARAMWGLLQPALEATGIF